MAGEDDRQQQQQQQGQGQASSSRAAGFRGIGAAAPRPTGGITSVQRDFLPFEYPEDHQTFIPAEDYRESVMSVQDVASRWEAIFNAWRIPAGNNELKARIVDAVLWYFIYNGSSPRSNFSRNIVVDGLPNQLSTRIFVEVFANRDIRRFARRHADMTRALLSTAPPAKQRQVADANGMDNRYNYLAFDYAEFCTNLTEAERLAINLMKSATLRNAAPEQNSAETMGAGLVPNDNVAGVMMRNAAQNANSRPPM